MIGAMEPTPEECEQIARSIAMSPALTRSERERVMELLDHLALTLRTSRALARPAEQTGPDRSPADQGVRDQIEPPAPY